MTWITDKTTLTIALSGYTEIKGNLTTKEAPETRAHKSYTITVGVPQVTQMMNNSDITVRRVFIGINYRQKNISEYDSNVEDFEDLKSTISGLSPFVSFVTLTPPERWEEKVKQTTAKIEMFYGVRID